MLKRIITALIGLVVFAAIIFSHHYVLYIAIPLVIMAMLYEMYGAMDMDKRLKVTGFCAALILCAGFILGKMLFAIYGAIVLYMLMMIVLHSKVHSRDVLASFGATLFISLSMLAIIMLRKKTDQYTVILPFICAWLSDTGAYFVGTFLGKHKLVPSISPKKTVEGSVGGIILSTLGSAAFIIIICLTLAGGMPRTGIIIKFGILGLLGSIISQLGDLIASCIKRDFEKKDYGSILPGHGGLLDRFDSVLFVTPFVYYAMLHFIL